MKNLIFLMMAILLINVSYAGDLGEDLKGDCVDSPNYSRGQEVVLDDNASSAVRTEDANAKASGK